jgi:hypothetical protein
MKQELALKIVLGLVGVLFLALAFPMAMFIREEPALSMMLSLYVTLGVFLLVAIRNPPAHRSLIAFTAWSSLVHAALMGTQAMLNMVARGELIGVAVLVAIGIALLVLAPAKLVSGAHLTAQ